MEVKRQTLGFVFCMYKEILDMVSSSKENPYSSLPNSAFWKTAVAAENPYEMQNIYKRKFQITKDTKIATAGSCFAQHITRHLLSRDFSVLDVEPAPPDLPKILHKKYGFSTYSARYGNIYTVKQLLQLAQEASGSKSISDYVLTKGNRYYDGLRPSIEPDGFGSEREVIQARKIHIQRVKELFKSMDLFIFTLGLTEMWCSKEFSTVFPACPGTIVGEFDPAKFVFKNAQYQDIIVDFNDFQKEVRTIRDGRPFKILLTVSPVPLTASASGHHALVATTYSKSVLRAVAGQLSTNQAHIDYFPSFELATNPRLHSTSFAQNLRTIRSEAVENVMRHFFNAHLMKGEGQLLKALSPQGGKREIGTDLVDDTLVQCEEQLLEAFGN